MRLRAGPAPERLRPVELQGPPKAPNCPDCGLTMQAKGTRTTMINNKAGRVVTFACERCEQIVQRAAEAS
jgi:tRNA(Ile2) C34 agmatinyltransferase TiaS